jgi:DNA-binding response OmpR family regulator
MGSGLSSLLRTLVVEARPEHGHWLVEQINRAGFKTDLAASWVAARAQGVDAVLAEPFSLQDITARLTAFSVRSRPLF